MCGIAGLVCMESVPSIESIHYLFVDAASRGSDGFGVYIYNWGEKAFVHKVSGSYKETISSKEEEILTECKRRLKIGSVLLAISRNAPETEPLTSDSDLFSTMQPIIRHDCALVHNGAVSHRDVLRFQEKKLTKIDSEVILLSYIDSGRNMVEALEDISGGWGFILHDQLRKKLLIGSSFVPLAHGYIKGMGYIVHTLEESIKNFIQMEIGRSEYTRVWEDFYFNEIRPYSITTIDLESGLVTTKSYKHKFIHPTWISREVDNPKQAILVSASGGIDSTLELILAKKFWQKNKVVAVHFKYGQKSQEAELLAVQNICDVLRVELLVIDLSKMFSSFSSMLLDDEIRVTTGTEPKTTSAWVPNRNGVFLNCLAAIADDLVLKNVCDEVGICAGFPLITEESVYPDNSGRFIKSFQEFIKFATLAGSRGRIKFFNPCQGLTKAEELVLYKYFHLEHLFGHTVSCDRAIVRGNRVRQCSKDGMPACGSGLLSWWASKKAGLKDTRSYYEIDDPDYKAYIPDYLKDGDVDPGLYSAQEIIDKVAKIGEQAGITFG